MKSPEKRPNGHTKEPIEVIAAQASSDTISAYRDLLLSEWTKALPQDVLSLLWTTLSGPSSLNGDVALLQILNPHREPGFSSTAFRAIVARIAEGKRIVGLPELPELPENYNPQRKPSKIAVLANRLSTYLTISAHAKVIGDTEFLADLMSLAFQATFHFVLPELREKSQDEHAILLNSSALFAIKYTSYEPAHTACLMSTVYDYLGDSSRRLKSLTASFRLTYPDDHSYLTKAQELWTELLDQNKFQEAKDFLLSLYAVTSPEQHGEVREMIDEAFGYILTHNPGAKNGHRVKRR